MGKGIIFNVDSDWFLSTRAREERDYGKNVDEKVLNDFIDQFKGTDVSDIVMCMGEKLSVFPSKVKSFYGDRFNVTYERGAEVDYSKNPAEVANTIWYKNGLDPYKIWFERCRKNGINPWMAFRMNDAHDCFAERDYQIPKEVYENFETHSRVRHREQTQYFDRLKDFEVEEVRETILNFIDEALDRYDVYGIELDYQREFNCFQIGHEVQGRKLMTELVIKIKETVLKYEKKYNHKIKIIARALESPITCEEAGLDIVEWARLGLIDMYVPAPRWWTINNDMPIRLWKQILAPYGVEVAGSLELFINSHPDGLRAANTVESVFGTANNILSQGADQLYSYNIYPDSEALMPGSSDDYELMNKLDPDVPEGIYRFYTSAGSLEKLSKVKRKNIITYSEKLPLGRPWDNILPLKIVTLPEGAGEKWAPDFSEKFTPGFLRIPTGYVSDTDKITLRMGVTDGIKAENLNVYVNSMKCTYTGEEDCGKPYLYEDKLLCFDVPAEAMKDTYILMAEIIKASQDIKDFYIGYADVVVEPKI